MKYTLTLTLLCISISSVQAQTPCVITAEELSNRPVLHTIDAADQKEPAVVLMDKRRIEYIDENNETKSYRTLHKIVHVNNDKGIEAFNTIYLPVTDNADITDIHARTILPDGKTIELDKKDIRDLKEKDRLYKIFALEGLVKGCEVEFYYTYKTGSSFFGRESLQSSIPVLNARVEIVAPERLVFETKSFNGLNAATDTITNGKRCVIMQHNNIPGVDDEKYSMYTANLKRLEYKLSYNKSRNASERVFTWNELAKRAYSLNGVYTDKELKKTDALINDAGWKNLSGEREKVIAVENYLKKNVASRDDIDGEQAGNIEWILKNKISSHRGMGRLFGAVYNQLGITYEFVLCGSRDDYTIDRSFENWNNCNNTLIYFPGLKKFISPVQAEVRFPWFNPYWGATDGIYCKVTTIGSFTTAIASIKPIPLEDYTLSSSDINTSVRLNESLDTLIIDAREICTGYSSTSYRAAFNFNSAEEQKQMIKNMVKNVTRSENIISSKLENQDFESYPDNKPVIFSVVVKSGDLVERAGNKVLIKIGELIGPQTEMYQEKPRQLPMEVAFPHTLNRVIKVEVPEGYRIKNLDDLIISKIYKEKEEEILAFVSGYTVEGNTININVREAYPRTSYPLLIYNEFKTVINAAADFNKVVLVLEKKPL